MLGTCKATAAGWQTPLTKARLCGLQGVGCYAGAKRYQSQKAVSGGSARD